MGPTEDSVENSGVKGGVSGMRAGVASIAVRDRLIQRDNTSKKNELKRIAFLCRIRKTPQRQLGTVCQIF